MHNKSAVAAIFFVLTTALATGQAPSPMPVVVPAITAKPSATATNNVPVAAPADQATVRLLEEIKAANEETLRKQEAALAILAELEKDAEQIRILSKRG
ncbi:MAG: hypothetical protein ABI871_04755 [Chthoniobacterales bacterium]